jgi:hypothetical protein
MVDGEGRWKLAVDDSGIGARGSVALRIADIGRDIAKGKLHQQASLPTEREGKATKERGELDGVVKRKWRDVAKEKKLGKEVKIF